MSGISPRAYIRASTGTIQTFQYDGRGRQVRSATCVDLDPTDGWDDLIELSATETIYGDASSGTLASAAFTDRGRAIISITRERLHDYDDFTTSPVPELDGTNSVATYTYNWYDIRGNMIASASLGTGNESDDIFANDGAPDERPEEAPTWTPPASPNPATLNAQGLPAWAKITTYTYDDQNRQTLIVRPDGTATRNGYNNLGQLLLVTENAWDEPESQSQTGYFYDGPRLVKVAALANDQAAIDPETGVVPWSTPGGDWQITEFVYGAPVVFAEPVNPAPGSLGGTGLPLAHTATPNSDVLPTNKSVIGAIHFPDPATGLPRSTPDLTFTYYLDGMLATRTDALGVSFEHAYDELGNRTHSHINTAGVSGAPYAYAASEDFIRDIHYTYDPATGELLWAQATADNGTTQIVATHRFDYDQRGNLLREYQVHGQTVAAPTLPYTPNPSPITGVPVIDYVWDYSSADPGATAVGGVTAGHNFNRLAAMIYPPRPNANGSYPSSPPRRTLTFHHGDDSTQATTADLINHFASRPSRIGDSVLGDSLAEFQYAGAMRRVGLNRGFSTALAGLGFAVAQTFAASQPAEGYPGLDRFGRIADLRFEGPGTTPAVQHEYQYGYDSADQPIWKVVTQRDYAGQSYDNQRSWLYGYDGLHRLAAADMGALSGLSSTPPAPAIAGSALHPSPRLEDWSLDPLGNWDERTISPIPGDSAGTQTTMHDVDRRNELEAVGTATTGGTGSPSSASDDYIYDLAGNLVLDDAYFYQYDAWGRLAKVSARGTLALNADGSYDAGAVGDWVVHYTYDALGRLARLQRPLSGFAGYVHTEHFYYDGVRRVQEVFNSIASGGASEESSEEETTTPTLSTWAEREYIHTAGPGSYVDEYVCEVGNLYTTQTPLFHLQDANYNALGLVNAAGAVVRQHTFDAYGRLIHAEDFATTLKSRVGHQGLFFTRLDAPQGWPELSVTQVAAGTGGAAPLTVPVVGLYHTHNRSYAPGLGRWLQRDPNGTGAVVSSEAWRGQSPESDLFAPSPDIAFADGANLHRFAGCQPTIRTDPGGLMSWGQLVGGLGTAAKAVGAYAVPGPSDFITGMYASLFTNYSANLSWDVEWATDWDLPDQMNTREDASWVEVALLQGLYDAFEIGIPFTDVGWNPLSVLGGRASAPVRGLGSVHGHKILHWGPMVHIFNHWKRLPGVTGLTTHQALRGKAGNVLRGANGSTLFPDVQFWYRGRCYIYEVQNTNPVGNKLAAYRQIFKDNGLRPDLIEWRPKNTP